MSVRFHREAAFFSRSLASKFKKIRKTLEGAGARLQGFGVFSSAGSFPFPKPSLRAPKKTQNDGDRHLSSRPGRKRPKPRFQTLTPSIQTAEPNHDAPARAGSEYCMMDRTRLQSFRPNLSKPSREPRERQFSNCEAQSKSLISPRN